METTTILTIIAIIILAIFTIVAIAYISSLFDRATKLEIQLDAKKKKYEIDEMDKFISELHNQNTK